MKGPRLLILTLAASMMTVGCLNWADAPYLDAVESLPPELTKLLQTDSPGARLKSRVYRKHMEGRWGGYRVVSHRFLFEDSVGDWYRGFVNEEGLLSVTPVTMSAALPEKLHALFFEDRTAMADEGRLSGRAWRFTDASTKDKWYEFEFEADGRRGLGDINASGRNRSAYYFVEEPR